MFHRDSTFKQSKCTSFLCHTDSFVAHDGGLWSSVDAGSSGFRQADGVGTVSSLLDRIANTSGAGLRTRIQH